MQLPKELQCVLDTIMNAGGRAYMVGGSVRDWLLGGKPKDYDCEVYGLAPEEIVVALKKLGHVDQVGASFGVIKLTIGKNEYDISLPRRESKAGSGHKGFVVKPDPSMTLEEALSRRDFTINAMAYCPTEEKIFDFYGGQEDVKNKVLRHTSSAFAEDPLRVLRGFQFAGRLGLSVAGETIELCRNLRTELPTLAKERIWGEWEKWALKSENPGMGLSVLSRTGWDEGLKLRVNDLMISQADVAAKLANENGLTAEERILLLLGVVSNWTLGEVYDTVVETLGAPLRYYDKLVSIHRCYHTRTETQYLTDEVVRHLSVELEPATVMEFSHLLEATGSSSDATLLVEKAEKLGALNGKVKPILMGKHLIKTGVNPGPAMGIILKSVYEAQLDGTVNNLSEALALARTLQTP